MIDIGALHEQWGHVISHPCSCGGFWLTDSESFAEQPDGGRRITEITRCPKCGKTRTFEFRLAPTTEPDIELIALAHAGLRDYAFPRANQQTKAAIVQWDAEFTSSAKLLAQKLRSEHIPGTHYYRGQLSRQPPYQYKDTAIEALFPADLRFLMKQKIVSASEITAIRNDGRDKRDAFAKFLLGHPVTKKSHEYLKVLQAQESDYEQEQISATSPLLLAQLLKTRGGFSSLSAAELTSVKEATRKFMRSPGKSLLEQGFQRKIWSLAQHYLLSTALLDVTSDINVALWFATHDWASGAPSREAAKPVIYRFDKQRLDHYFGEFSAFVRKNALSAGIAPPSPCFLITLDDIPETFACRPKRQAGGSIYGLDQLSLIDILVQEKALEIFEFLSGFEPPETGGLTSGYLAPADDPFLALVEEFKSVQRAP